MFLVHQPSCQVNILHKTGVEAHLQHQEIDQTWVDVDAPLIKGSKCYSLKMDLRTFITGTSVCLISFSSYLLCTCTTII